MSWPRSIPTLALLPILLLPASLCGEARSAAASAASPRTAFIEGVVMRTGTNEPIEEAQVAIFGYGSDGKRTSSQESHTDGNGRFKFTLDAGSYELWFRSNGYVDRAYPATSAPRIAVADGQHIRDLAISMVPTGNVSGRITDRNGDPLAHVPIELMQAAYDSGGRRVLQAVGWAETDDRGEYRIFYAKPGTYCLYAGRPWKYERSAPWLEEQLREPFSRAFYPGVPDSRQATAIVVGPGANLRGIDMALEAPAGYSIRGRIVDAKTGKAPESPALQLHFYDPYLPPYGYAGQFLAGENETYENGIFEFRSVPPGTFTVSVTVFDEKNAPAGPDKWREAYASVTVVDRDVDGIVIAFPASDSIAGVWRGERQPEGGVARLVLRPTQAISGMFGRSEPASELVDDGTFTIASVVPAEYRLLVYARPVGLYLKEARFAGADILYRPFQFLGNESSETSGLEVVLGFTNGAVEGIATDAELKPFRSATVVLVPKQTDRTVLFRSTRTDLDGKFRFANVVPGEYDVFAWDEIEANAYFDPDLLSRAEGDVPSVSVTESSSASIRVKVRTPL